MKRKKVMAVCTNCSHGYVVGYHAEFCQVCGHKDWKIIVVIEDVK